MGVNLRITSGVTDYQGVCVPRSLSWRESLDREENVGFELVKPYLGVSFIEGLTPKGIGLQVMDSLTGNHRKHDFTPLETIRRFLGIGTTMQTSDQLSAGVFEFMAGHYGVPLVGDYSPPGYDEEQQQQHV
ncbi:hypothetical protein Tco_1239048, partial [Tanacetum coccineum]